MTTHSEKALGLLSGGGVLRPRDLRREGIPNVVLKRLLERGQIQRVISSSQGNLLGYALAGVQAGPEEIDHTTLAEIAVQHPAGVLCLQSALRFHKLTDEFQSVMQVAVVPGANQRSPLPNVKVIYWHNPKMFEEGVAAESLGGVPCRITTPARTVADLFSPAGDAFTDDRMAAMSALVEQHGRAALTEAASHAQSLGWGKAMQAHVQGFMEGVRCSGQRKA